MIWLLGKIVGITALVLGIRSGYRAWRNQEENTIRFGTRIGAQHDSLVDLVISCGFYSIMWMIPLGIPLLILSKIWGLLLVAVVVGVIVYGIYFMLGKNKTGTDQCPEQQEESGNQDAEGE